MSSTRWMIVGAVLGLVVFVALGVHFTRPDRAEADVLVAVPPEQVRLMFTTPEALTAVRQRHDPSYRAVATGKRDTLQWTSEHHGAGTLTLTISPSGERVDYVRRVAGLDLTFNGTIRLVPEGSGTRVTASEAPSRGTSRTEQTLFDPKAEQAELEGLLAEVKAAAEAPPEPTPTPPPPPPPSPVPDAPLDADAGTAAPAVAAPSPDAG